MGFLFLLRVASHFFVGYLQNRAFLTVASNNLGRYRHFYSFFNVSAGFIRAVLR